jgi:23S rRNA A2030 N6-methylase RlmJ
MGAFILLASAGFIAWYFVWYPIKVQRRHRAMQAAASSLPQTIVWQ